MTWLQLLLTIWIVPTLLCFVMMFLAHKLEPDEFYGLTVGECIHTSFMFFIPIMNYIVLWEILKNMLTMPPIKELLDRKPFDKK